MEVYQRKEAIGIVSGFKGSYSRGMPLIVFTCRRPSGVVLQVKSLLV